MDPFEGQQWLLYVDVFGTIAVLSGFAFLFWTGKVMSIGTVNRIVDAYKENVAQVTVIFMTELKSIVSANDKSSEIVARSVKDLAAADLASRERMVEVTQSLELSLTRIEGKLNGGTKPVKRISRRRA